MSTVKPLPRIKPFRFPKPKPRLRLSNLVALPFVIQRLVSLWLDPDSYLALIATCKDVRKLGDDQTLTSNHARDVAYILSLVFDLKRNVFITGSAGCGKTFILNKIYEWALKLGVRTVMTATTGIASINLREGRTLHSFSGLRKGTIPLDKLKAELDANEFKCPKLWREAELLVCDEISMNGARFLTKLDAVGRHARSCDRALGGIPVVFSGDFCQLPPVADKFPFTSSVWNELNLVPVQLRYPFRQSQDMQYYFFLQRIRMGEQTEKDYDFLEDRHKHTLDHLEDIEAMDIKPTRLLSKQKAVQKINADEFAKLETSIEFTFPAEDYVAERVIEGKKVIYNPSWAMTLDQARINLKGRAEYQAPEQIQFKAGAQYVMTFNINLKKKHVNGSRCVYREGGNVEFIDGSQMKLEQCRRIFYYSVGTGNIFLCRKQVALRLGYAMTLHGSQGMTLDRVRIDLGSSIFCSAQSYIGLSRVRSADGLYIDNFCRKSIKTHAEAKKYMKRIERMTERISLNDIESDSDAES